MVVKTTVLLDDDIYQKLVKESIEKYGTTKKISYLINQKLRKLEILEEHLKERKTGKRLTVKLGRKLPPEKIEELIEESWSGVVEWNS